MSFGYAKNCGLTSFDRHVLVGIMRANVLGAGADQPIVVELLDHVCGPAGDAGDREHWRKKINVKSQGGIRRSRIKVHIGIELLFSADVLLNLPRHVEPL